MPNPLMKLIHPNSTLASLAQQIATKYIQRSRGLPNRLPVLWAIVRHRLETELAELQRQQQIPQQEAGASTEGGSRSVGRLLNHTVVHLRTGDVVEKDPRSVEQLLTIVDDWDG